jgi:hypothetical protein
MLTLIHTHLKEHRLSSIEFLRVAYYWRFDKDMPNASLNDDNDNFRKKGIVPNYVIVYLTHVYQL